MPAARGTRPAEGLGAAQPHAGGTGRRRQRSMAAGPFFLPPVALLHGEDTNTWQAPGLASEVSLTMAVSGHVVPGGVIPSLRLSSSPSAATIPSPPW